MISTACAVARRLVRARSVVRVRRRVVGARRRFIRGGGRVVRRGGRLVSRIRSAVPEIYNLLLRLAFASQCNYVVSQRTKGLGQQRIK